MKPGSSSIRSLSHRIAEYEGKIAELERKVGQLTMEIDLLKKGAQLARRPNAEIISNNSIVSGPRVSPPRRRCRTMKPARSTYYYRARRAAAREKSLRQHIINLCEESPRYGYRRVTQQLRADGVLINHKKVARIMRDNSLQVRPWRRFVRTTDGDHDNPIFPNLAAAFSPAGPNQLWVSDLTYVAIAVRFVFVAVILDAWSRRVVGYAISRRLDTRVTLAALHAAVAARQPPPGCIHHSDRGGQYAADSYRQALPVRIHGPAGAIRTTTLKPKVS
jgi:putative transposase